MVLRAKTLSSGATAPPPPPAAPAGPGVAVGGVAGRTALAEAGAEGGPDPACGPPPVHAASTSRPAAADRLQRGGLGTKGKLSHQHAGGPRSRRRLGEPDQVPRQPAGPCPAARQAPQAGPRVHRPLPLPPG